MFDLITKCCNALKEEAEYVRNSTPEERNINRIASTLDQTKGLIGIGGLYVKMYHKYNDKYNSRYICVDLLGNEFSYTRRELITVWKERFLIV